MKLPFRKASQSWRINHPRERGTVSIVGDAAIATPDAIDGKLVPLLILDTRERPDITEAISNHMSFPEGDVTTAWGKYSDGRSDPVLFLQFQRPTEIFVAVEFVLPKQGILIEHILMAKALYLQSGGPGDRLIKDPGRPKIIVGVPDTGFRPTWDRIFARSVQSRFRSQGLSRAEARVAAKDYITMIREIGRFRTPTS